MKNNLVSKLLEISIPDGVSAIVFYLVYLQFSKNYLVRKFWWISAILVVFYGIYENIKTIKSGTVQPQAE